VALSLACLAGVGLYALLSWLRAGALLLAGARLSGWLTDPVLEAGLVRSLQGDPRAGAEALRDLSALRAVLSGPAATTPFDLLWSPLLLAVLFMLHPAIGWLAVAGIGTLLALALVIDYASARPLQQAHALNARAVHQAGQMLHDRALSVGLGMQGAIGRRFAQDTGVAARAHDLAHRRAERLGALARAVRLGFQGMLISLGALLVVRHQASPGAMVGANLLLAMLLAPLDQAVSCWHQLVGARLAWRRLSGLLHAAGHMPPAANDDAPPAAGAPPGLVVQGLCFAAGAKSVLHDIGFSVAPGEMLLLTGPSGAGKSTLARLLVGVLPPLQGTVLLDGVPITRCDRARLVGYLPARLHLLEATVFETIARFSDAAPEQVVEAATRAGLHGAIGRLPDGYATRIGPHSTLLSGGQKQRLALARALFGAPRLLVLDEPDASLDHDGEAALVEALRQALAEGAVVVAVSHRAALAELAEHVLRLEGGRIVRHARRAAPAVRAAG
jgi:ATP-binding cassette subfamily C protein